MRVDNGIIQIRWLEVTSLIKQRIFSLSWLQKQSGSLRSNCFFSIGGNPKNVASARCQLKINKYKISEGSIYKLLIT